MCRQRQRRLRLWHKHLLLADLDTVVLLVPLTVWGGIDLDDAALHEGVGTQQLVIGGVVHNIQHTSALGDGCQKNRSVGKSTPCLRAVHR